MKVISTLIEDYSQWKKGSVLHININLTSIVHNLICKVNKHVALRLRLLRGGEHAAVGYTTVLEVS